MKTPKLLALVFAVVMVVGMFAGCQGGTAPAASSAPADSAATSAAADNSAPAASAEAPKDVITVSMDVMDADKCGNNPKTDYIKQTFGIEFQYIPVDWGNWNEKIKTWVTTNDMPDIIWWDLKGASAQEYRGWAQQGAFTEIPEASITALPNLNKIWQKSTDKDSLKVDGKIYAWAANRNNPEVAQNTYQSWWGYRRDWAKEVGMLHDNDVYTWDEWKALVKAVIDKKPGGVDVAGLVMDTWAFPHAANLFIGPVMAEGNETCSYIKGADGKYAWPPSLPEYKAGVIETYNMYQQGLIYKDNINFKASEPLDMIKAGTAFAYYNVGAGTYNDIMTTLKKNGLTTDDNAFGPAIVTFDGKFNLTQTEDYWSVAAFSNKVDADKMDRVLKMWDYLASDEGILFNQLGFKDKDYSVNADGSIKVLWPADPKVAGAYVNPYSEMRFGEFTPAGQLPDGGSPADMPYGISQKQIVWNYMGAHTDSVGIKPFDYGVSFFSAPNKDQFGTFGADVKAKMIELMVSSKDIGADWDAYVASMMPKVQPILDEINAGVK